MLRQDEADAETVIPSVMTASLSLLVLLAARFNFPWRFFGRSYRAIVNNRRRGHPQIRQCEVRHLPTIASNVFTPRPVLHWRGGVLG
jgi:hypothetical protein